MTKKGQPHSGLVHMKTDYIAWEGHHVSPAGFEET